MFALVAGPVWFELPGTSGIAPSADLTHTPIGPSANALASSWQSNVVFLLAFAGLLHVGVYESVHPAAGSAPALRQRKFAGNGPALASWKST